MIKLADPKPDLAIWLPCFGSACQRRDARRRRRDATVWLVERPPRRRDATRGDASIAELKAEMPHFNQVQEHIQKNSIDIVIYS